MKFTTDTLNMLNERFGMFVHFGVYSDIAGVYHGEKVGSVGEWIMRWKEIPLAEYTKFAFDFNPEPDWATKLAKSAKKAGMRYAVLTTKHHDGYCLFKSDYTVFDHYHFHGRDLVKEFADAMRAEGLKIGLYYSHTLDWAERDAAGQRNLAFKLGKTNNDNYWDFPRREDKDFSRYFYGKCMPQVRELLTNYGDIFLIWFDFAHDITKEQSAELYDYVKELQPHCLVNSRIAFDYGDYYSQGDNTIGSVPYNQPIECLVTLNDTWGYKKFDKNWKTAPEMIEKLERCIGGQATLLLNVGPMGNGLLCPETEEILDGISDWVSEYKESIYNVKPTQLKTAFDWGYLSLSNDEKNMFVYLTDTEKEKIVIEGINTCIKSATEINGKELAYEYDGNVLTIDLKNLSDKKLPVLKVELSGEVKFTDKITQQGDVLSLNVYYAEKFAKEEDKIAKKDLVLVLNIYDEEYDSRGIEIERNGALNNWKTDKEFLTWTASITQDGEYSCQIVTTGFKEKIDVKITVDGEERVASIEQSNPFRKYKLSRTGFDNERYVFEIGKFNLAKGEKNIKIERIGDGENLALTEVKFYKK